jgi:hypothetical protein
VVGVAFMGSTAKPQKPRHAEQAQPTGIETAAVVVTVRIALGLDRRQWKNGKTQHERKSWKNGSFLHLNLL